MNNIFEPLILARGSHKAGSGKGCAMNVISWETGDVEITDYPACSDRMLASLVQKVNDRLAGHNGLLSAENSLIALNLGHMTVGTSSHGLSDLDLRRVYVRIACTIARQVVHLDSSGTALPCIEAAERWAFDPNRVSLPALKMARDAAAANAVFSSAVYAAYASAQAVVSHSTRAAASDAADAFSYFPLGSLISATRDAITMFHELTGIAPRAVEPEVTAEAYAKMVAVRA